MWELLDNFWTSKRLRAGLGVGLSSHEGEIESLAAISCCERK
jgi:hypothetical protein